MEVHNVYIFLPKSKALGWPKSSFMFSIKLNGKPKQILANQFWLFFFFFFSFPLFPLLLWAVLQWRNLTIIGKCKGPFCLMWLFSHSVMSDSLRPHGLQHARLPCPSLSLGVAQTHAHWIGDAFQPSHPLLPLFLLPSVFLSIRVFSNESTLCTSWPKDGSFSFTICSSKEYLKLISLRIDWIDLLAFQGTLERVFSNSTVKKNQFFGVQPSLWSNSHIHTWLLKESQPWLYGPLSAKWCVCFLICCLGLS